VPTGGYHHAAPSPPAPARCSHLAVLCLYYHAAALTFSQHCAGQATGAAEAASHRHIPVFPTRASCSTWTVSPRLRMNVIPCQSGTWHWWQAAQNLRRALPSRRRGRKAWLLLHSRLSIALLDGGRHHYRCERSGGTVHLFCTFAGFSYLYSDSCIPFKRIFNIRAAWPALPWGLLLATCWTSSLDVVPTA